MRDLPSGTVTFLFTDIEGSTRLLQELGGAYASVLDEHRRALREAFAGHSGVEVDTQGDAFFYAFARASEGLAAAQDGQRALAGGPVRVRMGVHTGEPVVTAEGYVGADVHAAARIAACAHGGQIVVSARTREFAGAELVLTDLGDHRLKDFDRPVRLFQLGEGTFPPLRTLHATNLPKPASSFVGRGPALAEASAVLAGARLVTVTGPGGCGKTRFAIELAGGSLDQYPDGVWWVPLASVQDARLVIPTADQASGSGGELIRAASMRRMLVVLDNLEHLMEAAGELAELMRSCPNLTLLVTSRELLRIDGEHEFALPGLSDEESSALFLERAHLEPSRAVAELARSLEGLPLAIELAAARTSLLTPAQILERLSQRLDLFRGGRDADPRHQTLRATIEWSESLLDSAERRALARFSVLAGGADVDGVEQVTEATADTIQSLLDKSLIRRSGERLWMPETVREFAAERLEESGEEGVMRARHAHHYLAVAESLHLADRMPGEPRLDIALTEQDNFRAALEWAAGGDVELGLRMMSALETLWVTTDPSEAVRRFEQLLAQADGVPPQVLGDAHLVYGSVAHPAGGDELAEQQYLRSLEEYRRSGDERRAAGVVVRLGYSAWYRGDLEAAGQLGREGLEGSRRAGDARTEAQALGLLGELEFERGAHDAGLDTIRSSIDTAAACGFAWWQARMLLRAAKRAHQLGHDPDAERWSRQGLALAREMADRRRMLQLLDLLGALAACAHEAERAGALQGAVAAELARTPLAVWEPVDLPGGVEDERFQRGARQGRLLSLAEAVDYALADAADTANTHRSSAPRS